MPGLQPIAENNQSFTQKPCFVTATVIFNNKMQRSGGADYITEALRPQISPRYACATNRSSCW
nr:Uncharacterised protein [Klebsiella pneumoniae]